MVSAVRLVHLARLAKGFATEFPAPNYDRVFEQPALLQVGYQSRRGLIGFSAAFRQIRGQVEVMIPTRVINLNKANSRSASRRARGQPCLHPIWASTPVARCSQRWNLLGKRFEQQAFVYLGYSRTGCRSSQNQTCPKMSQMLDKAASCLSRSVGGFAHRCGERK